LFLTTLISSASAPDNRHILERPGAPWPLKDV